MSAAVVEVYERLKIGEHAIARIRFESMHDVIVVGGGGSGLAAAVAAAEQGADVLLLEKQPRLGGTTGIAVGSFTANRTKLQRQVDIIDHLDDHCTDAAKFADPDIESQNNRELRRYFLQHSADTLHWLMEMGIAFHGPSPEPPNRVARMHNVVPGAKAYIATLQARLLKLGGTIRVGSPVMRLTQSESGESITGVVAFHDGREQAYRARLGVVLAAGDYANDAETICRFKGNRFAAIEGINPNATGDGHRLAEEAGARLVNMGITYGPELRFVPPPGRTFQQLLPATGAFSRIAGLLLPVLPQVALNAMIRRLLVTWQHPEEALFRDGAILINANARRFCDEMIWPEREIAVAEQPDKQAFVLLDQHLAKRYSQWPHFISTAPKIAYAYVSDYLKLRPDVAIERPDLRRLAIARDLPVEQLVQTVSDVNEERKKHNRPGLDGLRWVLLGPVKAWFTTTEGGAAINTGFQVLGQDEQPIAGLYAVGQNGLGGQILWGHGLHIAWAMTSGRLLGTTLGKEAAAKTRGG